jgi:hypothetical protein
MSNTGTRQQRRRINTKIAFGEEFLRRLTEQAHHLGTAPIMTATGQVDFLPGRIRVMPPEVGFLRLLEFHRCAIGSKGPFLLSSTGRLTQQTAKRAYGNALIAILAQISVIPVAGRERILDRLCVFLTNVGSMEGLESVWLTALMAADSPKVVSAAIETFERLGTPRVLGSGVKHVPILAPKASRIFFASTNAFSALRKGIHRNGEGLLSLPDLSLVASQSGPYANGPLSTIGISKEGDGNAIQQWFGRCANYVQVTAELAAGVGALATSETGPGALAGAGAGAIIGGAFGVGMCLGDAVSVAIDAVGSSSSDASSSSSSDYTSPTSTVGGDSGDSSKTSSGNTESSGESSGESSDGDGDHKGDTIECGGSGPDGYPSPDDPSGNDGGAPIPRRIPSGAGLASAFGLTGAGYLQFGAFPQLDAEFNVVSAGFVSM